MVQLNILLKGKIFASRIFDNQALLDAWLDNEKQQDFWNKEFTTTIVAIPDPVKVAPTVDQLWNSLRIMRDGLLFSCDWTQLPDAKISEDLKNQWNTYRQALRDLPAHTTDPANPIWPVKPK